MYRYIINETKASAGGTTINNTSGLTALDAPRSADPLPLSFGVFAHCVGYLATPISYGYYTGTGGGVVAVGVEQTLKSFVIGSDGVIYGISYSYDYFQTKKINGNQFPNMANGVFPSYGTSTSAGFATGGLEFFMAGQQLDYSGTVENEVAGTRLTDRDGYAGYINVGHPVNLITTVTAGVIRSLRPTTADYHCPVAAACAVANGNTAIQTGGIKTGIMVINPWTTALVGLNIGVYSQFIHRFIVDGTKLDAYNVALANSMMYSAAASVGSYSCVYGGLSTLANFNITGQNNRCSRYDFNGTLVSGAITSVGTGMSFPTGMGFPVNGANPSRGLYAGLTMGGLSAMIGIDSTGTYVLSEVINEYFKSASAATVINNVGIIKHGNVNIPLRTTEPHSNFTLDKRHTRAAMSSSVLLGQSGLVDYISYSDGINNTTITRINSSAVFLDTAKYLDDIYSFAGSGYTIG